MSYSHKFHWPAGPNDVIVTGPFDNWSGSIPLVKTSKGDFEIELPLKKEADDKILFKFIVDGEWTTSKEYEISTDEHNNQNNVLYFDNLSTNNTTNGSKIPEAGGLAAISKPAKTEKNVATTVMPSTEGQQKTLGEPGVVIPSNAQEIKEFNEVRDVDAKALNEKLHAQEAAETGKDSELKTTVLPSSEGQQQTLGEPGVVIPENANDIKEFTDVRNVDAKELNDKLNGKSEKKTIKVKKVIKRNKITGEEHVISTEPIEDEPTTDKTSAPTLDPKVNADGTVPQDTTKAKEQTSPVKSSSNPSPKKTATPSKKAPVKEEKKKGGFFKKVKKLFD